MVYNSQTKQGHTKTKRESNRALNVAIVSTYPPRQCGLASFAKDVYDALTGADLYINAFIAAIDRQKLSYADSSEVKVIIDQDSRQSYIDAVKSLKKLKTDIVLIQHEYGIFGGRDGEYLLGLTKELKRSNIPYAMTLHTILSEPGASQRQILHDLCDNAALVTVFTDTAKKIALNTGVVTHSRISLLSHGSPEVLQKSLDEIRKEHFVRPTVHKLLEKLDGRRVMSTFGLLGPGKGLEMAIAAMSKIAQAHPDASYVIVGATHPEVVREKGEQYREALLAQVERLGLSDKVHFLGEFLEPEELACILNISDLYVTPYKHREQVSSGTLTYAVASGTPIVSTPYFYAEDLCNYGIGKLTPFDDHESMAGVVSKLLANQEELEALRKRAGAFGQKLTWSQIGKDIAQLLRDVADNYESADALESGYSALPALKLEHLQTMTTDKGIVQFSDGDQPDFSSGYCVDDVSRLAIVAAKLHDLAVDTDLTGNWAELSLRFMEEAYDPKTNSLRNLRTADMEWLDDGHLGDHVGRAVWSLGDIASSSSLDATTRARAVKLIDDLLPCMPRLGELRPAAECMIGIALVPRLTSRMRLTLQQMADRLLAAYKLNAASKWKWFENSLVYDNARLPQAMILAGKKLDNHEILKCGLDSLNWFGELCRVKLDEHNTDLLAESEQQPIKFIGNHWLMRDASLNSQADGQGDEQPLDTTALVEAYVDAYLATRDKRYASAARRTFTWFLGNNHVYKWLYDSWTGGCFDGLLPNGTNHNMGAESTLAYYQALLALAENKLVKVKTQ